jgi:hypothetical protein
MHGARMIEEEEGGNDYPPVMPSSMESRNSLRP